MKALAINPNIIYEKKLKLEGTQIELIHKYINPLLNIALSNSYSGNNINYQNTTTIHRITETQLKITSMKGKDHYLKFTHKQIHKAFQSKNISNTYTSSLPQNTKTIHQYPITITLIKKKTFLKNDFDFSKPTSNNKNLVPKI